MAGIDDRRGRCYHAAMRLRIAFLIALLLPLLELAAGEIVYLDVRTPQEFAAGHLEGAILIPHTEIEKEIARLVPDKGAIIHTYCRSGRRSGIAKKKLEALGYTNVTNRGGFTKLQRELAEAAE